MITTYYRPKTLEEALKLLSIPETIPMGGGTTINQNRKQKFAVVDLQLLGLEKIYFSSNTVIIGATAKLQSLNDTPGLPEGFKIALNLEKSLNLRNMSTVAGSLMAGNGRSPFLNVMLAVDSELVFYPQNEQIKLGDFLPLRIGHPRQKLITKIVIPESITCAFEYVARTPFDKIIICASLAHWSSGRDRLVIGGWGESPCVAFDGTHLPMENISSIKQAAQNAASHSDDAWASKEYRQEVAGILAMRCAEKLLN